MTKNLFFFFLSSRSCCSSNSLCPLPVHIQNVFVIALCPTGWGQNPSHTQQYVQLQNPQQILNFLFLTFFGLRGDGRELFTLSSASANKYSGYISSEVLKQMTFLYKHCSQVKNSSSKLRILGHFYFIRHVHVPERSLLVRAHFEVINYSTYFQFYLR